MIQKFMWLCPWDYEMGLKKLYLSHNQLAGIPESICKLNLDYKEMGNSFLSQNHLCIQFLLPECIDNHYGDQNCSEE